VVTPVLASTVGNPEKLKVIALESPVYCFGRYNPIVSEEVTVLEDDIVAANDVTGANEIAINKDRVKNRA